MNLFTIKGNTNLFVVWSFEQDRIYGYPINKFPIDVEWDVCNNFALEQIENIWEINDIFISSFIHMSGIYEFGSLGVKPYFEFLDYYISSNKEEIIIHDINLKRLNKTLAKDNALCVIPNDESVIKNLLLFVLKDSLKQKDYPDLTENA